MAALEPTFQHPDRPELADQRPIVRSEPVILLETAEFDSDGLDDARQRSKTTRSCLIRLTASRHADMPTSLVRGHPQYGRAGPI